LYKDLLPLTHVHEFYFMIDYMCFYTHDYYNFLNLYVLYYIFKHMGIYFDDIINWLHWLCDVTWNHPSCDLQSPKALSK
jgi:hypothetical protein